MVRMLRNDERHDVLGELVEIGLGFGRGGKDRLERRFGVRHGYIAKEILGGQEIRGELAFPRFALGVSGPILFCPVVYQVVGRSLGLGHQLLDLKQAMVI